ncbi:elongation factor Ts [Luteolibacter pohnpeiensis]|uniref:Elongation factor Ts n=1 Tax=Luteolibacter pohnpeiensis TaxID=454153 RepID=A0A934SAZ9_9BACT|nr:translation elongation factor Ts [Luteolibacter pohnpeiensis]MBK1884176.1 elongation factor Ts [Luteolibacter pohnpeiensis]
MTITAATVKELRDKTNAGMMDCKRVLAETNGDIEASIKLLRERGIMKAGTKTDRAATEGIITARVADDASSGILLEINCETDFVSRNENFQAFVSEIADFLVETKAADLDAALAAQKGELTVADTVKSKVVEVGENLQLRKYVRFDAAAGGVVASYIHLGGKVGVLLEVGTTKPETAGKPEFQELIKDLTLHIAACAPKGLSREDIPQDVVDAELEIYRARLAESGKPANIIENILKGQIGKFFAESCFLEQGFVKDDKVTVTALLEAKGKEVGDTLTVTRFVRFGLGE